MVRSLILMLPNMKRNRKRINMPGSKGYNSKRGSGASFRNVARRESQGSAKGGPKVYRF